MSDNVSHFSRRTRTAGNDKSSGKLMIFSDNTKELVRQANEFESLGYDVYPIFVTSEEIKAQYCDTEGKITKYEQYDQPVYQALLGNYMVSSREDVMRLLSQIKPDAMITGNAFGYNDWANNSEIMDAAQRIVPMIPKIVDMGAPSTDIPAALYDKAKKAGFHILGSYEYFAADALIKSVIAAQRGQG